MAGTDKLVPANYSPISVTNRFPGQKPRSRRRANHVHRLRVEIRGQAGDRVRGTRDGPDRAPTFSRADPVDECRPSPAVSGVRRAEASLGGRYLALVPDQLGRLVALPVSAQVPKGRGAQSPPGEFGDVPIGISQREAVVDADVGALKSIVRRSLARFRCR